MIVNTLADWLGGVLAGRSSERAPGDLSGCAQALLDETGEMRALQLARDLLDNYRAADVDARRAFFAALDRRFGVDPSAALRAARAYADEANAANYRQLQSAAEPQRLALLRRLNLAPGATLQLVRMREDLLDGIAAEPDWAAIDQDFEHLFSSWFNRGFLTLERIDWHTPASVLQNIIRYEAVHAIDSWDDLRNRLEPPDRRCYAFFHPAIPHEPLVFVEVALSDGALSSIDEVLDPARSPIDPIEADTAVFYSISNCQRGLRGVSFGNLLIKQVASELSREFPQIRHHLTLSPVPGLVNWLRGIADRSAMATEWLARLDAGEPIEADPAALAGATAHYLLQARRGDQRPLDPVARFHLGNGARLERIIPGANPRAAASSLGVMVSYAYLADQLEANHNAYYSDGTVAASNAVQSQSRKITGALFNGQPA